MSSAVKVRLVGTGGRDIGSRSSDAAKRNASVFSRHRSATGAATFNRDRAPGTARSTSLNNSPSWPPLHQSPAPQRRIQAHPLPVPGGNMGEHLSRPSSRSGDAWPASPARGAVRGFATAPSGNGCFLRSRRPGAWGGPFGRQRRRGPVAAGFVCDVNAAAHGSLSREQAKPRFIINSRHRAIEDCHTAPT